MTDNRILLIRTGGTIDSEPYDDPYNPPDFVKTLKGDESLIMKAVKEIDVEGKVDGFTWGQWQEDRFVKDSQEFTPDDIAALADIIKTDSRRYFILTHGTDGMVKNATLLQEALKGTDKVVVFTGAMVPLSMVEKHKSDALPALSYALKNIEGKTPGVYVTGRDSKTKRLSFFDPQTVEKDKPVSLTDLKFTLQSRSL